MIKHMDDRDWKRLLERKDNTNKYDYGHVLVVGGSDGMAGAPLLAARAALRVGAGLVTIASTSDVIERIGVAAEEIMTETLPDWSESTVERIVDFIERRHVSVVVVGPGLSSDSFMTIRDLVGVCPLPIIIDAGALAAFNGHLDDLRQATKNNASIVMTPHTGEYAKLAGGEPPASLARRDRVTLVLKGHRTVIYGQDGSSYQNHTGNPGLATAGTGDVLTGMIAGLVAQGFDTFRAATMAVYLHGMAGDRAEKKLTEPGMIASDVIDAMPDALREIQEGFPR
jgi:NAD(P)H-hydrate epimerase